VKSGVSRRSDAGETISRRVAATYEQIAFAAESHRRKRGKRRVASQKYLEEETILQFLRFPTPGETKEAEMRMVVLCAAVGATLMAAIPASAQVVVRDRDDIVIRDRDHDSGWWHRHHGWYRNHAECGTVRVRKQLPNGNVIVKTRRSC
jgi:hypothetical protein